MKFPLLYPSNIRSLYRAFYIFVNPFTFILYLIYPFFPCYICLRTPIGIAKIFLRNRQSARTLYSIFIREDYIVDKSRRQILDLGSNIGISAVYFLTRNSKNRIYCIEPDPGNKPFLEKNLIHFKNRVGLEYKAISIKNNKSLEFNLSKDGKYSSFIPIGKKLLDKIKVETLTLNQALINSNFTNDVPITIKIDIEGIEKEVIKSFDFSVNLNIKQLIVESTGLKNYIKRRGEYKIRNGYVEHVNFSSKTIS